MSFGDALVEQIPRLRRYAQVLTRNRTLADDLVQDCLACALKKQHLFVAGTNLRRWLFAMMHNQHVDNVRISVGESARLQAAGPSLIPTPSDTTSRVVIGELTAALAKLPPERLRAMMLFAVDGMDYEEIAAHQDIQRGTVSSRIYRGRAELARRLDYHSA